MGKFAATRVWTDSPHEIRTQLTAADVRSRLAAGRYQEEDMVVFIRSDDYLGGSQAIALRRGTSSGFQRFFFFRIEDGEQGASLVGEIRSREWAMWFLNGALGFVALIFVITIVAVESQFSNPDWHAILGDVGFLGILLLLAAFLLGMAQLAMISTAPNEEYLLDWLRRRLS